MVGRLSQHAVQNVSQAPVGPGSASAYRGSRSLHSRYDYKDSSNAAFVELSPDHTPFPEDLHAWLRNVGGVTALEWSGTSQYGDRYSGRSILVYTDSVPPGSARVPLEFQVTRKDHMTHARLPFTVTILFKDPPVQLVPVAWCILRAVTRGKELLPLRGAAWEERFLRAFDQGPCQALPARSLTRPSQLRQPRPGSAAWAALP